MSEIPKISNTDQHPIIDRVPWATSEAASEQLRVQQGQPVPVEGFRGDPRRVIGHPANATNEAAAAYAEQLKATNTAETNGSLPPEQAAEWGALTLHGAGVTQSGEQVSQTSEAPKQ